MDTPNARLEPAAPWRRLAATIYDLFPVVAIWFGIGFVVTGVRGFRAVPAYSVWFELLLLAGAFVYFGWSWRRGGQTLGMKAWRIAVVDAAGRSPGWARIALRFGVMMAGLAALPGVPWALEPPQSALRVAALGAAALAVLGALWALVDRQRRMGHDLVSGTRVVALPAR
jgi:uncharacterized RDD family membrane protein YckC